MAPQPGKLSERAKKVLTLADDESRRFNHDYIGTEHLLLGLVAEGQGIGGRVLRDLGVDIPRAREAVLAVIGRGTAPLVGERLLSARADWVLSFARDEAKRLGHRFIGTEHLLLGLVQTQGEHASSLRATAVLTHLGLDLARIRPLVMQSLAAGAAHSRTRDNVVTCRVDDRVLEALDALVEAGVYTTRSEAAARLILAGLEANRSLLDKVYAAAAQIRRARDETQALTQPWTTAEIILPSADDHGSSVHEAAPVSDDAAKRGVSGTGEDGR